jgi:hypothetical protein
MLHHSHIFQKGMPGTIKKKQRKKDGGSDVNVPQFPETDEFIRFFII